MASLAETAGLMVEDLRAAAAGASADLDGLAEAVDAIGRRSRGLMRFVEGYRRFAEPPVPEWRRVPIAALFERCRLLVAKGLRDHQVTLTADVAPEGLAVDGDADLLDQALLNLIKNSVEALEGRDGGLIRLTAALDPRGRVAITLADNGPGLPPGAEARIFVPFFTTKPRGSGIGLSVVRQIMLAHGGAVETLPTETGAAFRLTFKA